MDWAGGGGVSETLQPTVVTRAGGGGRFSQHDMQVFAIVVARGAYDGLAPTKGGSELSSSAGYTNMETHTLVRVHLLL